jgi:hypothetical protein
MLMLPAMGYWRISSVTPDLIVPAGLLTRSVFF